MTAMMRRWTVRTRWTASFLCFAVGITVVVSAVLFSWYKRDSVAAFGKIAQQELVQAAGAMEILDASIKYMGFDLVQNPDVLTLMAASAPMERYAAVVRGLLISPMLSNSLIASIYLVNRNGNFIIGSPLPASVNVRDYHRRIVALINERKENAIIRIDAHTEGVDPAADATTVYTSYVFFASRMSMPDDSFVIVNLRSRDILARVIAAGPSRSRVLVVLDGAGRAVFEDNPGAPLSDRDIDGALRSVRTDARVRVEARGVAPGRSASLVAFYAAPEALGYRFVTITPYREVLRSSMLFMTRTIAFAVLILVAGAAAAFLIARRFYRPLGRLLAKYGASEVGAPPGPTLGPQDEYQRLEHLLESSSARVTSLDQFVDRNLPLIRQEYLQRILDGRIRRDDAGTKERLRELGVEFPHDLFRVVVFAVSRRPSEDRRAAAACFDALRQAVGAFAQGMKSRGVSCEVVEAGDGVSLAAVLNYEEDAPERVEAVRDACMAVQARSEGPACPPPTVAIGRSSRGDPRESWSNARELLGYRVKYGDGALLDDHRVAADIVGRDLFPQEEGNELVEAIRTLSVDRMRSSVARMIRLFRGYAANDISRAVLHVLYRTLQDMDEMTRGQSVAVDRDALSVHARLSRCGSLAEMERELVTFYEGMIGRLAGAIRRAGTSHAHLMKKVVDFISESYADPQLSLEQVADHVEMSTTYLGRIFKEYVGIHFTEYINKIRLEKAQALLVETTMNIAEVAARAGFNSPSYFITCFRKHTGMTPASYRNAKAL
jgi:AraC-like DNA-binding protein